MDAQLDVSRESYAGRIAVLAGPTGHRHRSDAEKALIAAKSLAPDAVVADIARRYRATRLPARASWGRSPKAPLSFSLMIGKTESSKSMTQVSLSVDAPIRQLRGQ
jgi:hypothetical protein